MDRDMKLYIDTEFNGFNGKLISLALVPESNDNSFYEVLECENPVAWVASHVMPFLNKKPISYQDFQKRLESYLQQFNNLEIIADWPEDIKHFTECLILDAGIMMQTPSILKMTIDRTLSSSNSLIPHNALEDAKAIKKCLI